MITKEKICRINELAKKSKTEGLTEEERSEQKCLRDEYIAVMKQRTKEHLDRIIIVKDDQDDLLN